MPTILRKDGFRFFFFSREGTEPPHIHVEQAERYAKFWLEPAVLLEESRGFHSSDLLRIHNLIGVPTVNGQLWNAFHNCPSAIGTPN